jgi:1-aminocyclopropane-1-carboxylate deaminase/D-cysteine desulfhydrase-like pyridoxal-dependent ACC family enzyme
MTDNISNSVFRLSAEPVLGQVMQNITVLRLDRMGGLAPGNKAFKLRRVLAAAKQQGVSRILSFGGAWSNHLHALAAMGAREGLQTIGVVRGTEADTAMLRDVRRWGMQVVSVSREEYRRRNDPDYQRQLTQKFAPCLLLPEGGASIDGVLGCTNIAALADELAPGIDKVVVPVGTGTTLAGLAAGLHPGPSLVGVAALKNATDLEQRVNKGLQGAQVDAAVDWTILHDHHCGGFARASEDLKVFMLEFERVQGLLLEPVYTGKMFLAVHQLLASGAWRLDESLLLVHTGGLQGRRGYPWLAS